MTRKSAIRNLAVVAMIAASLTACNKSQPQVDQKSDNT